MLPKFPISEGSGQRDLLFAFPGVDVLKEHGGDTLPYDDSVNCLLKMAIQCFGFSAQDVFSAVFNPTKCHKSGL
jgi:hypothetical protein